MLVPVIPKTAPGAASQWLAAFLRPASLQRVLASRQTAAVLASVGRQSALDLPRQKVGAGLTSTHLRTVPVLASSDDEVKQAQQSP